MEYIEIMDSEDVRLIKFMKELVGKDIKMVRELEGSVKDLDKRFILLDLRDFKCLGRPRYIDEDDLEFSLHMRRILTEFIYMDKIFVAFAPMESKDLVLEILLATDYILYPSGSIARLDPGYLPLNSGLTYIFFRGGAQLLNILYRGIEMDRLRDLGFIDGEIYRWGEEPNITDIINYNEFLYKKLVLRERFLRDFHHYNSVEEALLERLLYSR